MKTLIALVALAILMITPAMAQERGPLVYAGLSFDQDKSMTINVGAAQQVGAGLWVLEHSNVGQYGALDVNLAYFITASPQFSIGIVAGPGAEFQGQDNPVAYITGGSGLIALYEWDVLGVYAAGRYNFALDEAADFYVDGWTLSAGFTVNFGE